MPDNGHEAADKELKRLEKELTKHYKQAAEELTKKAEAFMRDFERKDAQMKKLVDAGKMTEQDYMNWRRNQAMTNERIQEMKDTLAKDLAHADQIAAGMIDATLPSAYAENFNFGTYEIETGTTIDTGFTLYDKKTVENLMKKDPDIIPQLTEKQKKKIPEDERWNRKKLTSAIAQGILQGESVPAIATRLQSVAIMDRNAAIRNARTYTTAAENKGRVDSIARANDMGIPADQEWIATLDDRTRMEHRHLDGQVRPVGEYFETDGYRILYPGDPHAEPEMIYNCRCTLVSKVKGRIYNDERNDSKLNGMSYEEWKHAKDRQIKPEEEPKEEPTTGRDEFGMRRENGDEISNEEKVAIIQEDLECNEELAEEIREALDLWTEEGGEFKTAQIIEEETGRRYGKYTEYAHLTELYIENAPSYTGTMYRGLSLKSEEEAENVLKLARENDPKAFNIDHTTTSWTADKEVVEDIYGYSETYKDGAAVIFVADEGHTESTSISHFENGGLAEVLVSRDAAWEYVNDERDGNTIIIHVREAKETQKEKPAHTIVEGKDLTGTWERRPEQFDFEIEDVMNAQGFDGLPQVVTPEEFDKAVKEANGGQGFIAQRTYSAPDKETLEAYRESLYNGKWYVDCSTGGASYGRGMYTASTNGTKLTDNIKKEMNTYQEIANNRLGKEMTNEEKMDIVSARIKDMGLEESVEKDLIKVVANQSYSIGDFNEALKAYERIPDAENLIEKAKKEVVNLIDAKKEPVHRVETITLDPRAKVTTYEKLMEENRQTQADVYQKYLDEALGKTSREELALFRYTTGTETKEDRQIVRDLKKDDREKTQEIIDKNKYKWKEINREANEKAKEIDRMDIGTFAALKGYDAYTANAEFSGADYTVILNRTKTIIKGG